jgi:hypothetical protein
MPDLADLPLFVEIHQVYRKLHEKGVDRFARDDPQPFTGIQPLMLEEAGPALRTGIRQIRSVGQNRVAGMIPH